MLWTAGFVLLTLIINAPLLPLVLRVSGLSKGAPALLCSCLALRCDTPEIAPCHALHLARRSLHATVRDA